ncbi:MAG: 2Fe-2S iron-sulfur cluster binding domain-containing protein [Acidobacteria bacterium]|nr:2Fe-2S iron-sulfur cluster binding domain-containing protein [Acidobacteriota bacterium]
MTTTEATLFEAFLNQHDSDAWTDTVNRLIPKIHLVDKNATKIWFTFFPLDLAKALQSAENPAELIRKLQLKGNFYLKDQIDSSHIFLYGHRFWPEVKSAIVEQALSNKAPASLELATQISDIASIVAKKLSVDISLVIGITSVAFMTLQQVGITAFKMSPGKVLIDAKVAKKSPETILENRAKDNSQGLIMQFLRTIDKVWTVTFNENDPQCTFKLIDGQDIAMAGASDKRDYKARDPRCVEGPVPVECRSAACGTCWVGVLGGAEKLVPVSSREKKRIREFGYIHTDETHPVIRLACVSSSSGALSIVVPPWNGVFGRHLRKLKEAEKDSQREPSY